MVVTAAIWLLFIGAAVRPPFFRGPPGFAVFAMTMTVNEIPVFLLGVFVLSLAFSDRPVGVPWTVVSAVLAGVTVVGLIWLQVRARFVRTALEVGLDQGLGQEWRTAQSGHAGPGKLPPIPWRRGILLSFQRRTGRVTREKNLSYGPDPAHRVDVYRGPGENVDRPVLIHLHGGGFVSGSKSRESVTLLNQLAAHGWLCLSGNYRLRAAGQHPNPLVDTKRLIAWTRENADKLGANPAQVFVCGCSAGGHLAVCAALTPNVAEFQAGFDAADTSVAGVIAFYGYLGPRAAAPSSSPALLARPDAPPMLIVHGADDTVIPVSSTHQVAAGLRHISRSPVVFVELPHTQHSFDLFASVRSRIAANAAEAFLNWALLRAADPRADATHKR